MTERRFSLTLKMGPVPARFAMVFRARGMQVPLMSTSRSAGALIPLRMRAAHRAWAHSHGYFWIPCPLCLREFGGHEITDTIPDPIEGEGRGIGICPFCTIERNREVK